MRRFLVSNQILVVLSYFVFFGWMTVRAQTSTDVKQTAPSEQPSSRQQPALTTGNDSDAPSEGYKNANAGGKNSKAPADARPVEDWNTLTIPRDMKVADPKALLHGDFPEFTREFVQAIWRQGDVIDLYVLKPVGVEKPPVMLYLYSFPSDTDRFHEDDFAKLVTKNGFAAVGFVSALTGPRYHSRPQKEWFISELQEALASSVHDVQLILNYLDKRGDLDMSRVGMYGGGSGGSIAIMAAAVDPRIKVVDLLDPWGDWPDWLAKSTVVTDEERSTYLKPEFLKKVENVDPMKWLPTLTSQQVRLQYIHNDATTPASAREHIEKIAPRNIKIVDYKTANEYLESLGGSGDKMFDWAKDQLRPTDKQEKAAAGKTKPSAANN